MSYLSPLHAFLFCYVRSSADPTLVPSTDAISLTWVEKVRNHKRQIGMLNGLNRNSKAFQGTHDCTTSTVILGSGLTESKTAKSEPESKDLKLEEPSLSAVDWALAFFGDTDIGEVRTSEEAEPLSHHHSTSRRVLESKVICRPLCLDMVPTSPLNIEPFWRTEKLEIVSSDTAIVVTGVHRLFMLSFFSD